MASNPRLLALRTAAFFATFVGFPLVLSAQSITTEPTTAVPISSPWLLLALWLTVIGGGIRMLRRRGQQAGALATAVLLAAGLWLAHAQAILQFTDPAGETLALPVTQIESGGDVQGFERPSFTNATDVDLRISSIVEPDFDDCFPDGLDEPLPSPDPFTETACAVGMVLGAGESCTVDVDAMCRARVDETDAIISASPASVAFAEGTTGLVTVTVDASSPVPATNVLASIPGGSTFSVQSITCGATLVAGASCTITFTNASQEGPTSVSIAGDNTNTATVDLTSVSAPMIALTNPVQQNRIVTVSGSTLSLEVTNDAGSATNALDITVVNKAESPNLSVDDTNCTSVAPGASCTLELSSNTPYAPARITIGGSNTGNTPQTLIVFSYLGGLVFEESAGSGKIVIDVAQEFTSAFVAGPATWVPGASSFDDGVLNTNAIVAHSACSDDPANCAAQRCRDIGADWYLPARGELMDLHRELCSNTAIPCNAGGFSSADYWSSTAPSGTIAFRFPSAHHVSYLSFEPNPVRCVRSF